MFVILHVPEDQDSQLERLKFDLHLIGLSEPSRKDHDDLVAVSACDKTQIQVIRNIAASHGLKIVAPET